MQSIKKQKKLQQQKYIKTEGLNKFIIIIGKLKISIKVKNNTKIFFLKSKKRYTGGF